MIMFSLPTQSLHEADFVFFVFNLPMVVIRAYTGHHNNLRRTVYSFDETTTVSFHYF